MSLSEDEAQKLDAFVKSDSTLSNAFRLTNDADLLFRHERYSSVVPLAVLSLEEIGKYLLGRWSAEDPTFKYDKRKLHQMKQFAVAALFMASSAREECKKRGIKFDQLDTVEKMAELAEALSVGLKKEADFANAVLGKVIETVKWSGLYYGDDLAIKGIEPSKITKENAEDVIRLPVRAFTLLADEKNIHIARSAFGYVDQKNRLAVVSQKLPGA